jgi:hypothetical protein
MENVAGQGAERGSRGGVKRVANRGIGDPGGL